MTVRIEPPAPNPCGSCPYRKDVASGVWDRSEYEKLPEYDRPTGEQPPNVFMCHQQDGRACAGWTATHDMEECFGLRLAVAMGIVEDPEPFFDYETPVPLFDSGQEAADHGLREITAPGEKARRTMDKLERKGGVTRGAQDRVPTDRKGDV